MMRQRVLGTKKTKEESRSARISPLHKALRQIDSGTKKCMEKDFTGPVRETRLSGDCGKGAWVCQKKKLRGGKKRRAAVGKYEKGRRKSLAHPEEFEDGTRD